MAISHVKSDTIADYTGTVTIFNSLGNTTTANATDLVRPVDWNSAHNQFYTLIGNTNNASTASGTNVVLSGGNNITLIGNGSQIGISGPNVSQYLTTAMASNRGTDFIQATATFSGFNASGTIASSGITISVAPGGGGGSDGYNSAQFTNSTANSTMPILWAGNSNGSGNITFGLTGSTVTASHGGLTSQSNQAFSAGGGSSAFQTLSFGDANGITWSNVGGAVQASYSQSTHSHATPAYSGSNGSFTANTVTFGNSNNISFYTTNGSLVASYSDAGATDTWRATGVNTIAGTNTSGTFANDSYIISGAGNISVGVSDATLIISGAGGAGAGFTAGMTNLGNTSGNAGFVASQLALVGTGDIGLSQSTNGNSATLSFYRISSFDSFAENVTLPNNSNFQRPTQSTFLFAPIDLHNDLSFEWIGNLRTAAMATTTFTATTSGTTFSFNQAETLRAVLYTRLTGANSLSIGSVSSTTWGLTHSINLGLGTASTQFTISQGLTVPVFDTNGTSTYSTTYNLSSASLAITTGHLSNWLGVLMGLSSWGGTLSAGQYWVGLNHSTTITTQHTNLSGVAYNLSFGGAPIINATVRTQFGGASTQGLYNFNGSASVAGGTAISSVSLGQLTMLASNVMAHIRMGRF